MVFFGPPQKGDISLVTLSCRGNGSLLDPKVTGESCFHLVTGETGPFLDPKGPSFSLLLLLLLLLLPPPPPPPPSLLPPPSSCSLLPPPSSLLPPPSSLLPPPSSLLPPLASMVMLSCCRNGPPWAEFRGGPYWSSQIDWGSKICKVLPGCMTADSKTPMYDSRFCNHMCLARRIV
jgi:hypothetical protein